MKLKVDKDICIGCGACQAIAPNIFEIDDDGLAICKTETIDSNSIEDALDAKEGCPVNAIKEEN